jgi:hypothetical protein
MYFLPKRRIGKISAFMVVVTIALIFGQYFLAMLLNREDSPGLFFIIRIICAWIMLLGLCISGITSIISIAKYKDYAVTLFVTSLLGILGIIFLLGDFLFQH